MTGAGFILPNFNADAGDGCPSLRIVPITTISDDSLLAQLVNQDSLILGGSRVSLRELVD